MFFRPLPSFVLCAFLIGCSTPATHPQSPTVVAVPAVVESSAPENTTYHCDGNPFHIEDRDYCAYDIPATWGEAQRACNAISARLLTFSSYEQMGAVRRVFGSPVGVSDEAYWIGLREADDEEGAWQWTDGSPLKYRHWNEGEPNDDGGDEDCAEWRLGTGSWNDAPCWAPRPYICKQRGSGPLTCDGTTLHFASGDICFSKEAADWETAKLTCHAYGGELAILSTPEKDATLPKAVGPQLGLLSIWIGYSDAAREGQWRWISGTTFEYRAWKPGEPNNFHEEDCVEWFPEDGLANDLACSARRPYVCERIEK